MKPAAVLSWLLVALAFAARPALAQQPDSAAIPKPLMLVNGRVIVALPQLVPADLASLNILKSPAPARWQAIAPGAVLLFTLKKGVKLPTVSQQGLRRQAGVRGPVRFLLNGQPLDDPRLRVASGSVAKLAVRPPAPGEAATTIDIQLVPDRTGPAPAGVYIRGMASDISAGRPSN